MDYLKPYAFMYRIFPFLERVSTWKSFYSALLRFSAFGAGLLALVFCFYNFRKLPNLSWWGDIGVFLFNAGILVTAYMVIHLFWNRSQTIQYLEHESYPVLRVCSHMARLTGELFAALSFGLGISAGITIAVVGRESVLITYGIGFFGLGSNMIVGGIFTIIAGMGYGVLSLLIGRMCYEGMVLMIDMSNNVRKIRVVSTERHTHKAA